MCVENGCKMSIFCGTFTSYFVMTFLFPCRTKCVYNGRHGHLVFIMIVLELERTTGLVLRAAKCTKAVAALTGAQNKYILTVAKYSRRTAAAAST